LAAAVRDWAELAKIGQYYATQDMLGPSYGADTLGGYYAQLVDAHRAEQAQANRGAGASAAQGGTAGGGGDRRRGKKSGSGLFYQGLGMPPTTVIAAKAVKAADALAAARDALFRGVARPPPAVAVESAKASARSRDLAVVKSVAEKHLLYSEKAQFGGLPATCM
jgi:hypothetical protein